jgi:hypothetical protein
VRWSALCRSGYRQRNTTSSLHLKRNSEWISYGLILLSLCIECGMEHKLLERCWVLSLSTYLFSSENFTSFCYSVKHFCNEEGIRMQIRTRYASKLISMLKIFCFFLPTQHQLFWKPDLWVSEEVYFCWANEGWSDKLHNRA